MFSIFGMIIFVGGISGFACAIWMFFSNNGGFLYWLSILIGLVCIPVIALGYVLVSRKPGQEAWHEFIRALVATFGVLLMTISLVALTFAVVIAIFGERTGVVEPMQVAVPLGASSLFFGIPISIMMLAWAFKRKHKQNS